MKIGMPILYEYDNLEDNFKLAKELGADFIELNLNFGYCRDEMENGNAKKLVDKYGIETTLHFYDEGDLATYDEVADAYLLLLEKYIKFGHSYIKNVNFHNCEGPIVTISGVKNYMYDKDYDQYIEKLAKNLAKVKNILDKYHITFTLENVDRFPEFMKKTYLFELENGYSFCYDIGHDYNQKKLNEFTKNHDIKFKEFHIHDSNEKGCHLSLGKGNINLKVFKDLAQQNNAYALIEVKQSKDLIESIPYFKNL